MWSSNFWNRELRGTYLALLLEREAVHYYNYIVFTFLVKTNLKQIFNIIYVSFA